MVDKEPITTYDIEQTMKTLNIPKNQALGILINEKMELSQIKQFGIYTSELELDNAIGKMLAQNKISLEDFKRDLQAKGQNYEQFRSNFKKDFEKENFMKKLPAQLKPILAMRELKNFSNKIKINLHSLPKLM